MEAPSRVHDDLSLPVAVIFVVHSCPRMKALGSCSLSDSEARRCAPTWLSWCGVAPSHSHEWGGGGATTSAPRGHWLLPAQMYFSLSLEAASLPSRLWRVWDCRVLIIARGSPPLGQATRPSHCPAGDGRWQCPNLTEQSGGGVGRPAVQHRGRATVFLPNEVVPTLMHSRCLAVRSTALQCGVGVSWECPTRPMTRNHSHSLVCCCSSRRL